MTPITLDDKTPLNADINHTDEYDLFPTSKGSEK